MRGLYIAETAMLVQEARLETVSHNLANLRTGGYKTDRAAVTSFAEQMIRRRENGARPAAGTPVGGMAHGVAVAETRTDFSAGVLEETGRPLDLALVGEGYFQVESPEGFRYTRNGHFLVNAEGFLVTAEGRRVWGAEGPLKVGGGKAAVSLDGTVTVDGEPAGRLRIVTFPPDSRPVKTGANLFQAGGPVAEGRAEVWSGYLEGSNVDLTREMTALVEIRRAYEAVQRAFVSCDELLKNAANELGAL